MFFLQLASTTILLLLLTMFLQQLSSTPVLLLQLAFSTLLLL